MQFGLIPSGFVADCGCPDRQQAYQDFMWLTAGRRFVTANLYALAAAETSAGMRLIRTSADGAALYSFREPKSRGGWGRAQYRLGDRRNPRLYCDGVIGRRAEARSRESAVVQRRSDPRSRAQSEA